MKLIALGMILLLSLPAQAELKFIPKWTMLDGKACYDFEDARKLLLLDSEFDLLVEKDSRHEKIVADLKARSSKLEEALAYEKAVAETQRIFSEKLNKMLLLETERANKAEARPGMFPAWFIAGAVGLTVGFVLGVALGVYITKP